MSAIVTTQLKVDYRKKVLFEAVTKIVLRSFSSTQVCGVSYVNDIRKQMDLKRYTKNDLTNVPYKDARFLVIDISKSKVLLSRQTTDLHGRKSLFWAHYNDLNNIGVNVEEAATFLRVSDSELNFAVNVASLSDDSQKSLESKTNAKFTPIRAALFNLDGSIEMPLVSQSHSLLDWKLKHRFCSNCGSALENGLIELQKKCSGCNAIHYPTVSPIGISLICNEQYSRVLLVRQPIHPPGMFTCVAGFIESGETIEENIKREVAEELGLEVNNIQYIGSQHWSLPGSKLMIGCLATVGNDKFSIDSEELEEARWFDPEQIHDAFNRVTEKKEKVLEKPEAVWIPPPGAIAHSLIKLWLQKYC